MFLLASSILTPPFAFFLLYFNIVDQPDGTPAAKAQEEVWNKLFKHPLFYLWAVWTTFWIGVPLGLWTAILQP